MLVEQTISFLCLYNLLISVRGFDLSDKVAYNVSKYFAGSNYNCFGKPEKMDPDTSCLRRCKFDWFRYDKVATYCIFCPMPCSYCGKVLETFTLGTRYVALERGEIEKYHCMYHSIHAIEPRKIVARKGKTITKGCKVKEFCKVSPCQNSGTCVSMYYSYTCICPDGFHGKHCTYKTDAALKGKLTNGVQLWFPLEVVAARPFPFFVTVAHEADDQLIEVSTQTGYSVTLKPKDKLHKFPHECKKLKREDCGCNNKGCKIAYSGTLLADKFYIRGAFFYLPVMISKKFAYAFITNITIRVYNDKFKEKDSRGLIKPVFENVIPSFASLKVNKLRETKLKAICQCELISIVQQAKGKHIKLGQGDCPDKRIEAPEMDSNSVAGFSTTVQYTLDSWRIALEEGDPQFSVCGDRKDLKHQIMACTLVEDKAIWRLYKVSTLFKMTRNTEYKMAINNFCKPPHKEKHQKKRSCEVDKKVMTQLKGGEYLLRLTLRTYGKADDKRRADDCQNNYFCYFKIKYVKKPFNIQNPVMKDCIGSVDTMGYDKEGKLVWTCTAKKGGPCPPEVAQTTTTFFDNLNFKRGEYEICITWFDEEGNIVEKVCTTLVAKHCTKAGDEPDYVINCLTNCGTKPDPKEPWRGGVVDRRHDGKVAQNVTYKIIDPDGKEVPLKNVTITTGAKPYELKINLTKLDPGKKYKIIAVVPNEDDPAKPYESPPYEVTYKVMFVPKGGNCTVEPTEGMKGYTLFNIECLGWQTEGTTVYEFFDKAPGDIHHFEGRMFAYSYSGLLSQFRLTRGRIVIYILNEDGEGPKVELTVKLEDFNRNMSHLEVLKDQIDEEIDANNYDDGMGVISVLAEVLYKDMNNYYYIRYLLDSFLQIRCNSVESVKLGISTMRSLLVYGTLSGTYVLDDQLELATGKILLYLTSIYLRYAVKPDVVPRLRAKYINQLTRNVMDIVDMSIIAWDRNVTKLDPEEDVDYDVLDNWNDASNDISEALMIATYLVGRAHRFGDPGAHVTSAENVTDLWAYVDSAVGLVNIAGSNLSTFVNMTMDLALLFDKTHDIMLQFALMNKNLFWWNKRNMNTEVIMVGLAERLFRPGYYYVPRVDAPLHIFMKIQKLEKTTVGGVATQLDKNLDGDTLDRILLVHRFILPPLAKLFISFNFNGSVSGNGTEGGGGSTASSLRVLIDFDKRPTWEDMDSAQVINAGNPKVNMPYDDVEREHFYYMGILPDKSVPVNESVSYSFDVYFINCQIWEDQWLNHYCLVGPNTTEEVVQCLCTHLSVYSSVIDIPFNDVNPILDAPLYLTLRENRWVITFLLVFLIVFLLLLLWAWRRDERDAQFRKVIVLHDNYPGESYAYLIAIFTGTRLTSGTSAAVGLRLYGDTYVSRPTVLKYKKRNVLQRDNDDWFLLCYPVKLGNINAVQLWHDNGGRRPDWFCSRVIVFDLIAKVQYLFIVEQWLALETNEFPEAMVRPATSDEVMSIKRIFLDNSVLGLRENHLHLSVLRRHPRSPVTRKQRLAVLMVLIMTAMLISLLLFYYTDEFDYTVDEFRYKFTLRDFVICIQTYILSTIIAFIAMLLFWKSFKQAKHPKHSSTLFMPRKHSDESDRYWRAKKPAYVDLTTFIAFDQSTIKRRKDMTCYQKVIACLKRCTHYKTHRPVYLGVEDTDITVNKFWLFLAWLFSVLVILVCAFFVVYYSLKLGKMKSLKWLGCLLISQLLDIFVFTPLKIFIVAILLSMAFERATDLPTFNVDVNKAIRSDMVGKKKYLNHLISKRKADEYYPMSDEMKAKKRRKAMKKMKWKIILDFLAVLAFIIVLCCIMARMWSGAHYHPNSHAQNIIMTNFNGRFTALKDVFNRTQFFDYLENSFVRSLYVFRWYNNLEFPTVTHPGFSVNRKDWAKDFVGKLVGTPRLRQLRVVNTNCTEKQQALFNIRLCPKPWSYFIMDRRTYAVKWRPADVETDLALAWGHRTSWTFVPSTNTSVFPIYGHSGIFYPSGGYLLNLDQKRAISKSHAIEIEQEHWVDERTRAVFIECTLFNVNNHLFSQVTGIVEHMPSGVYTTTVTVRSVHTKGDWNIENVIYIIFIVALFIRIAYKVNRNGMSNFSKRFLNVYEVTVISVGIISVIFFLIHIKVSSFYVERFNRRSSDQFFNFKEMIRYFLYTRESLWTLFLLLVFRLFITWHFGPTFVYFYNSFLLAKRCMVMLMVVLYLYFIIIWRLIGYTLDAKTFHNYRIGILYHKMYYQVYYKDRNKMIALALCLLSLFFVTIIFTTFTHYYRISKRKKLYPMNHFNSLIFFINEVKRKKIQSQNKSDRQVHIKRDIEMPRGHLY